MAPGGTTTQISPLYVEQIEGRVKILSYKDRSRIVSVAIVVPEKWESSFAEVVRYYRTKAIERLIHLKKALTKKDVVELMVQLMEEKRDVHQCKSSYDVSPTSEEKKVWAQYNKQLQSCCSK